MKEVSVRCVFSEHRSEKGGRSDEGKVTEPSQIWQQKDSD
jgi:hypothetical protein